MKVSGIKVGKESVKVTFRENGNTREEECRVVVGADGVIARNRAGLHEVIPAQTFAHVKET